MGKRSKLSPVGRLKPRVDRHSLRAVIETPKGSRNKFDFDPKLQLFKLSTVLPVGESFPFDFGFIPGTKGADGDPLDVMLLMDEPAFPGCVIEVRLIGVIEATQTDRGKKLRNDRLIAVSKESHLHRPVKTIKDIDSRLLAEIEEFFIAYNTMKGEKFKPLDHFGPKRAMALVRRGQKAASRSKR
jgi:inorganic pyrophosphatase